MSISIIPLENVYKKYPALSPENAKVLDLFRENLGDREPLTAWDLSSIKIPAGGALSFNVPILGDENGADVRFFEGVIVGSFDRRAFWIGDAVDGSQPDCSSNDAIIGVGNPGGVCAECPYAEYGSSPKTGRGQACKLSKQLFIARADVPGLPEILSVPPSSLKVIRKYLISLASNGIPFYGAETKFSLVKEKNEAGNEYSKLAVGITGKFDADAVLGAKAYTEGLRPIFTQPPVLLPETITDNPVGLLGGSELPF